MSAAQIRPAISRRDRVRGVAVLVLPALLVAARPVLVVDEVVGGALDVRPVVRARPAQPPGEHDRERHLVELLGQSTSPCRRRTCSATSRRPASGPATGSRAAGRPPRRRPPPSARWPRGRGRAARRGGTGRRSGARARASSCPRSTPCSAPRSTRRGRSCPRTRRARAATARRRAAGAGRERTLAGAPVQRGAVAQPAGGVPDRRRREPGGERLRRGRAGGGGVGAEADRERHRLLAPPVERRPRALHDVARLGRVVAAQLAVLEVDPGVARACRDSRSSPLLARGLAATALAATSSKPTSWPSGLIPRSSLPSLPGAGSAST